jgi:tripartite-type tricarboxylate transporter receptor subunit TctC
MGERMRAALGQPILIENVSGAAGSIGVGRIAHAPYFSLRQHNLTPLDLIVAETSRGLAMRTNNRRIAGDRNP